MNDKTETTEHKTSDAVAIPDERLVIRTTERSVKFGDKTVCSWREGIDREKDERVAIVDMNNADFLENKDWEELTKQDATVIAQAFTMLVEDMKERGV